MAAHTVIVESAANLVRGGNRNTATGCPPTFCWTRYPPSSNSWGTYGGQGQVNIGHVQIYEYLIDMIRILFIEGKKGVMDELKKATTLNFFFVMLLLLLLIQFQLNTCQNVI